MTTVSPESSTSECSPNSTAPVSRPTTATTSTASAVNVATATVLTASSRPRPTGTVSRYRSVPMPASPAIESPATTLMIRGRKNGMDTVIAVNTRNSPLPVIRPMNCGPSPLCGVADLDRDPDEDRDDGQHGEQDLVAPAPQQQPQLRAVLPHERARGTGGAVREVSRRGHRSPPR